ncbi:MAG: alkaline phosphatase family protein [Acidobacteriota bacterium]
MRPRGRLLVAAAAVGLACAAAAVVRVPSGSRAILSWRGGGTPRLLGPGFALRIPLLQRIERYERGEVSVRGEAAAGSREGNRVTLPYEASVRPGDEGLLALHREGGTGGARAGLRRLLERRLEVSAAGFGTFELASGDALAAFEAELRSWLRERFGPDSRLALRPAGLPPEVRASFGREAILEKRRETGARVLLIGLDGADWDIIDPMLARGELPHLGSLKRRGAWGRLRSSVPTLSPLLWTSIATGKTPDRHGINDFLVSDPATGRRVPINSTFRRSKALWNILTEAGLESDFIAWWATWPAEPVLGHLVSDRVAYSTFPVSSLAGRRGAVHPPEYGDAVESLRVLEDDISYEQVSRFVAVTEREYRRARAAEDGEAAGAEVLESIRVLVRVLAATETYRKVALDLLERRSAEGTPASLFAVYFQGIDEVGHRFAHCAPPRVPLCPEADYRRFRRALAQFYRYQDEILGEIIDRDPGATVIVMSDHGFASGQARPADVKPFIEGKPGLWHEMRGIFVAAGPAIRPGEIPRVTIYDVAPTILRILGLPVPDDMVGEVLEAAIDPAFSSSYPIERVPSYEGLAGPEEIASTRGAGGPGRSEGEFLEGAAEEEILEQLRSLGYIGGAGPENPQEGPPAPPGGEVPPPGGGVPTALYYVNLGGVYLGKGQLELAEAQFRKALRLDPSSPQALSGMAILYEARGAPERALEVLRTLVRLHTGDDLAAFIRMAEIYVRMGRAADGVAYMESRSPAGTGGRGRSEIGRQVALGLLHAAAGRPEQAERSYLRALEIDPASLPAMQELFTLLDAQGRAAELEPRLREALARRPRSGMLHNWLGLVLKRQGDLDGAEAAFWKALEASPELTGAMANLGSIYTQQGRLPEAVTVLRRALEKDRGSVESRANLIVALGLQGDLGSARALVDEAREMGRRAPHYHNALAYALFANGRSREALEEVEEALALDPRQPDALRLRARIESGEPVAGGPYR